VNNLEKKIQKNVNICLQNAKNFIIYTFFCKNILYITMAVMPNPLSVGAQNSFGTLFAKKSEYET